MRIINLLPKSKQQELRHEGIVRSIQALIVVSGVSFVIVFLAQLGSRVYLVSQRASIEKRILELTQQVNRDENAKIKDQITEINNTIVDFRNLSQLSPKWSKMVRAFVPLVPESVSVRSLGVDAGKKIVNISGYSPTREAVIELHDNIAAAAGNFANVDYPLENVSQPTNVNFHFSFTVSDELLK